MAADGKSLVTSVGVSQGVIWLHDGNGDRQISLEGDALAQSFSPDGSKLYYLVRGGSSRFFVSGELRAADLASGSRERVLPGVAVANYDLSPDGKPVIYTALDSKQKPRLWLASLERRFPARQLPLEEANFPRFGPSGEIFFQANEGAESFIYRAREDGSQKRKAGPDPVLVFQHASSNGRWLLAFVASPGGEAASGAVAFSTSEGPRARVCDLCDCNWSSDGRFFAISLRTAGMRSSETFLIPLSKGKLLPDFPPAGFHARSEILAIRGVGTIPEGPVAPTSDPSVYAFARQNVHRNLYRIPLP